jgi:hypothetical protein
VKVVALAGGLVQEVAIGHVDFQLVARADLADEGFLRFQGDDVAAVDRVAEEDAGVELGHDALDPGLGQGQGGMFARGAAAEVFAADDDGVGALVLSLGDEPRLAAGQPPLPFRHT